MNVTDITSSLKWNMYVLAVDISALSIYSILSLHYDAYAAIGLKLLPTLLFIESGIILLIGSFFELFSSLFLSKVREHIFHSKEKWSMKEYEKGRRKAIPYIFLGFYLLSEAFLSSIIIG